MKMVKYQTSEPLVEMKKQVMNDYETNSSVLLRPLLAELS